MTTIMHNNESLIDDSLYCSEYVQQLKPQKCKNTSCLRGLNTVFQAKLTCSSPIQFEKRLHPNAESLQLLLLQKKKWLEDLPVGAKRSQRAMLANKFPTESGGDNKRVTMVTEFYWEQVIELDS